MLSALPAPAKKRPPMTIEERVGPDEVAQVPPTSPYDPTSFDSPIVNAFAPPLVAGLAILFVISPLGFLLGGFHVWVHEFGHASVAWLSGRRALPLPFGWTNNSKRISICALPAHRPPTAIPPCRLPSPIASLNSQA